MARYIDAEALIEKIDQAQTELETNNPVVWENNRKHWWGLVMAKAMTDEQPTADVVPKSEVEKIFEKFKMRQCSNSVCAWCVHATDYGRRNEECDKPYIDKNGKEQKSCFFYSKFEGIIDKELAELKKKYTETDMTPLAEFRKPWPPKELEEMPEHDKLILYLCCRTIYLDYMERQEKLKEQDT